MASRSVVTCFLSLFFPICKTFYNPRVTIWKSIAIIFNTNNQRLFGDNPTSILTSPDFVMKAVHCGSTRIVLLEIYHDLTLQLHSHHCAIVLSNHRQLPATTYCTTHEENNSLLHGEVILHCFAFSFQFFLATVMHIISVTDFPLFCSNSARTCLILPAECSPQKSLILLEILPAEFIQAYPLSEDPIYLIALSRCGFAMKLEQSSTLNILEVVSSNLTKLGHDMASQFSVPFLKGI